MIKSKNRKVGDVNNKKRKNKGRRIKINLKDMGIKKFVLIIGLLLLITGLVGVISPIKAQTLEELIGQITELQGQLNKFLEQEPRTWCFSFRNDLKKGNSGLEVRILQAALEEEKFTISAEEKVSYYFGDSTFQAVIGFQEKYRADILSPLNLASGTGYVGSSTRAKLNQLYGCAPAFRPELEYRCPDIDGNGKVDLSDTFAVSLNVGACLGNAKYSQAADIDKDGCITTTDSDFVSKFYGKNASEIEQCKEVIYYSLIIAANGQGTNNPPVGTYTQREGDKVGITANPASGWGFNYWEGADNNSTNPTTVTMSSSKTVTAYFKEKATPRPEPQYKCPDIDGNGKVDLTDTMTVSLKVGVCSGNTNYSSAADIDGDECITATDANFVSKFYGKNTSEIEQCGGIVKYSLTLAISGQGTTNPSAGTYSYNKGTVVTIAANPASGWEFDYWQGADNNSTNPTTVTMSSNKTVTVFFKEKVAARPESQYRCPDIDGNGKVDLSDTFAVSLDIGICSGDTKYHVAEDFDWDGCITATDANFVNKFYGKNTSEIEQCKTTSSLENIEKMIASVANSIYQIAEQIKKLLK